MTRPLDLSWTLDADGTGRATLTYADPSAEGVGDFRIVRALGIAREGKLRLQHIARDEGRDEAWERLVEELLGLSRT